MRAAEKWNTSTQSCYYWNKEGERGEGGVTPGTGSIFCLPVHIVGDVFITDILEGYVRQRVPGHAEAQSAEVCGVCDKRQVKQAWRDCSSAQPVCGVSLQIPDNQLREGKWLMSSCKRKTQVLGCKGWIVNREEDEIGASRRAQKQITVRFAWNVEKSIKEQWTMSHLHSLCEDVETAATWLVWLIWKLNTIVHEWQL